MMQIYQNHVVFQSFSDLFYIEQQQLARQQQQQRLSQAAGPSKPLQSASAASSPTSSRAPSLLFNNTNDSTTSLANTDATEEEFYPAGLYNSSVERKRLAKEAEVATLHDVQLYRAADQDLSLRRFS